MVKIQVRSIDAWGDENGWYENQSFGSDDVFYVDEDILYSPRKLFAFLRKYGYLSEYSKGRVEADIGPSIEYFAWVCNRSTHEPVFSVSEIYTEE